MYIKLPGTRHVDLDLIILTIICTIKYIEEKLPKAEFSSSSFYSFTVSKTSLL